MPEPKPTNRDSILDMGKKLLKGEALHIEAPKLDKVTVKSDLWGFRTYEDSFHNKLIPDYKGHHSQCVNGAHISNTFAVINAIERGHAGSDNNPTISTYSFNVEGPLAKGCKTAKTRQIP